MSPAFSKIGSKHLTWSPTARWAGARSSRSPWAPSRATPRQTRSAKTTCLATKAIASPTPSRTPRATANTFQNSPSCCQASKHRFGSLPEPTIRWCPGPTPSSSMSDYPTPRSISLLARAISAGKKNPLNTPRCSPAGGTEPTRRRKAKLGEFMATVTTPSSKGAETAAKVLRVREPQAATLVIFGAGGDLTKRLVVPALYHLVQARKLPDRFAIIGVDRNDQTTEQWCQTLTEIIRTMAPASRIDASAWSWLTHRMHYMPADFTQVGTFTHLEDLLAKQREQSSITNVLFYLAVGERFFGAIVEQLGHAGLTKQSKGTWRRVIIEKPFGHDLSSAKTLNTQILKVLSENQIYRIDHFLGKETVQNILVLRFANGIFEPLWNRDH